MSKKTYELVIGCVGGASAIASAVVTYIHPAFATAIVGAIAIANTAVAEICALFLKKD